MLRLSLKFVLPALVLLALGGAMLWKSPMNPAAPTATAAAADSSERPVPPIDAAAPQTFETATFAFG